MRALVIKTIGDAAMANAIADGMENAMARRVIPLESHELEVVKAELRRLKAREAQLGVRVVRDRDYWSTKCTEAAYKYGDYGRRPGPIGRALWGVVGMVCAFVDGTYRHLSAINRGA